jgi:lipoprotein-anchoring transpeptidase ErfK/SrfK
MTRRERSTTTALLAVFISLAVEVRAAGDPKMSREGTQGSSVRKIIVSLADCRLALFDNDRVIRIYRTAVGAPKSPSPIGAFQIINRISDPTYYIPGKVVPPGPANPLGTRWLGLNIPGYGIHGTNQPQSIGRAASHGCIRLRNEDMEDLFQLVQPGDEVEIRPASDEELTRIFNQNYIPVSSATALSIAPSKAERH